MSGNAWRNRAATAALFTLLLSLVACSVAPAPEQSSSGGSDVPASQRPSIPAGHASQPGPAKLDVHSIPQNFTTPLLEVATDGRSIIWSTAAGVPGSAGAPNIFQFTPGQAAEPRQVFASADREAVIGPIGIAGEQLAFVETNPATSPGVWRLWYQDGPDAKPVLVDHSDGPGGITNSPYPGISIDGKRLAWTAFHRRVAGDRSELWLAQLPSLSRRLVDDQPLDRVEHYFPALDGNRLVYGTAETTAQGTDRHVYLRDLNSTGKAVQLDESGKASQPMISGDHVVWKESPDNVYDHGNLVIYSLQSGHPAQVAFGDERMIDNASVGDRFVAANAVDPTRFFVYDLVREQSIELRAYPPAGTEVDVRPHIRGRLLVWAHAPKDVDTLVLQWSWLPD